MNTATEKTKKYKPYPEYKDSGVEWLGEVPEHWSLKRLKYVDGVIMGQSPSSDNYNISEIGLPFLQGNADFTELYPKPRIWCDVPNKISQKDDVLLSVRAPVGAVNISDRQYGIGRGLCAIRAKSSLPKLLYYFALSLKEELNSIATGSTYTAVSIDEVKNIVIPSIPIEEQQAIADFLERRTGEIDELIAKKEQVVELLREKRTAIISHAVTKGLNPDAKMKDSGIDWLGEVPEHWEVKRLKRVSKRIQTGCTPPTAQEYYYEDGTISWYGPGNFGDDLILGEVSKLINESAIKDGVARLFEAGSTMIVAIGATIGKVGYIDKPASSNQQITAVAPNIAKVSGKFLAYQLKRLEQVLKGIAPNTTLPIMDQQKIGCLVIATPPISEQQAITDFLNRETAKIDVLTAKVIEAIEKLKEYRTALISAAVTGKIDVREVV